MFSYEDRMLAIKHIIRIIKTYARNSEYSDNVIYIGTMGCLTGFYFILSDKVSHKQAIALVRVSFRFVADFSGKIPGSERKECGKNLLHDLEGTKAVAADMIAVLDGYKPEKLNYRAETLCLKKFICITVSANQSQPFRQTEKDAKI